MITKQFRQATEHREVDMNVATQMPSVNFHLWKPCNMKCRFCFATFQDVVQEVLPKGHLPREGCLAIVEALAGAGFDKINFAGGEPTLCPWLPDLILRVKELALTTSIVTNGSRITPEWLDRVGNSLDWTALSIDTVDRRSWKHRDARPVTVLSARMITWALLIY